MEKTYITKNNIKIHSYENRGIHSFCIGLYLKAGCLYENEENNGITHFFEHVSFKNLNNSIGMDLADYLDMYSLDINGCTYKEFVQFKVSGTSRNFKKAADVISLLLSPLNLKKEDIECELRRIKAEIRESSEKTSLDYFTNSIVWDKTPLKNTICGEMKNLDRINFDDLSDFQKQAFSEGNFFFYVTGNFLEEDIRYLGDCVSEYEITKGEKRENSVILPHDFLNRGKNIFIKNGKYTLIRFSFDIDVKKQSPEVLDLLFDVLFYGEKAVIYKELSDKKGIIYSFDWAFEQYQNAGVLYFEFEVRKNKLYEAVTSVVNVLKTLDTSCRERLKFIKPRYIDNAFLISDNAENFNWERAYECHILCLNYDSVEKKIKIYESVCEEDLNKARIEIFRKKNLTLSIKADKKTVDLNRLEEIISKL